ncbi:class I SAM-dependent methyltransferase [Hyphococcus luteus]|uniref:Methyltransferase n=1 Tax=Hyphococcus luteus TaxID=2058213 RepID=A0A2S7K4T7_9PROT|nr:class I SAM-dependent methyltransferase [Marinicaulis flavus]PQA87509.1 methyltransferase [Marinicaulis flavus]
MKYLMLGAAALALAACSQETPTGAEDSAPADETMNEETMTPTDEMEAAAPEMSASEKLDAVLAAEPDDVKARYQYRHPKETLEFFGVEPGMTVVDILPGQPGWYGKILVPYLGSDGTLIGAEYPVEMWAKFGGDYSGEEFLESRRTFPQDYVAAVDELAGEDGANAAAFLIGSMPAELEGTADVVMMMRAAHHFNRIDDGAYWEVALADINAVLKPGGIVGVVQHRAPEENSDDWAVGNAGYLKQSQVVSVFEDAGFELVEASEINANPNDRPTEDDIVWRLPPSNDSTEAAEIGESDRMTLKFKKPE